MPQAVGPFGFEVLTCLICCPRDSYGLSIRDRLQKRLARRVSLGAIYTTLERLEAKGYISSAWGEATAERGGRRKRLYQIEAPGVLAVDEFERRFVVDKPSIAGGLAWDG